VVRCGCLRTRARVRDCVCFEEGVGFSYELSVEFDMVGDLVVVAAVIAVVCVCCGDGRDAMQVRVNWKLDTHMVACKTLLHLPSHTILIGRGDIRRHPKYSKATA
jgi:hypothetical protein